MQDNESYRNLTPNLSAGIYGFDAPANVIQRNQVHDNAYNGIFLSTAGVSRNGTPPNDMTLNGPFTYSTSTGTFEVTIGAFGALHLAGGLALTAPLFPNPLNIKSFTFVAGDPLANTIVAAAYNTTAPNRLLGARIVEEPPKKDKGDDKKAAAVCR